MLGCGMNSALRTSLVKLLSLAMVEVRAAIGQPGIGMLSADCDIMGYNPHKERK